MFKIGMKLNIKHKTAKDKTFKFFNGKVDIITEHYIVVKSKNYRECFKYSDFECGAAVLV